jgi:hypothetical protein
MRLNTLLSLTAAASTLALSAPALAQNDTAAATTSVDATAAAEVTAQADLSCMGTAVIAREDAVIAARTSFNANIMTAMNVRRDGLKNAYTIANAADRRAAIKNVWRTFNDSMTKARTSYRTSVNAAWKTFMEASAKCGSTVTNDDRGGKREKEKKEKSNRGHHWGQLKNSFSSELNVNGDARVDLSF